MVDCTIKFTAYIIGTKFFTNCSKVPLAVAQGFVFTGLSLVTIFEENFRFATKNIGQNVNELSQHKILSKHIIVY